MSSLDLLGFGALIVEPPDDQIRARDDDEGGHEADHDANLVRGAGTGVIRARGLVGGHCGVEGIGGGDWRGLVGVGKGHY